jgi:hypothetical protein
MVLVINLNPKPNFIVQFSFCTLLPQINFFTFGLLASMTLVSSCKVQLKVCNEYAGCMLERYKLKTKKEDNSYQPLVNNLKLGLCF